MKNEKSYVFGKIFNIALLGVADLLATQTWTRIVDHKFLWFHWTTSCSYSMTPTFRSVVLAVVFVVSLALRGIIVPLRTAYETAIWILDMLFLATLLVPLSTANIGGIPLWGVVVASAFVSLIGGRHVAGVCWAITMGISILKLVELNFVEEISIVYLLCGVLGVARQIKDMWGISGYIENTKDVAKRKKYISDVNF